MSRTTISLGPFRVRRARPEPGPEPRSPRKPAPRSRVDALLLDQARHGLGHQVAQRAARSGALPAPRTRRRRTAASPASSPGPRRRGSAAPPRPRRLRRRTGAPPRGSASSTTRSGSRQLSKPHRGIGAHHEHEPRCSSFPRKQFQGLRRGGRAVPLDLQRRDGEPLRRRLPPDGSSLRRSSRPGSSRIRLCGASPVGIQHRPRSSPSCQSASWASARCPRCGGLNAEPRTPMPAPSPLLTHLAVAADDVLVGGQSLELDRATGRGASASSCPYLAPIPNSKPSVKRVEALV